MEDYTLTSSQKEAEKNILNFLADPKEKYFILKGSYGTGKSFFTKHFLSSMQKYKLQLPTSAKHFTDSVLLTGTTKDACTVSEGFIKKPVKTIHSTLKLVPTVSANSSRKILDRKDRYLGSFKPILIYGSLIITDESSFVGSRLFELMEEAIDDDCKVILIGDNYQLAPVNDGTPIMDTLDCLSFELTEIKRNQGFLMKECLARRDAVRSGIFEPMKFDNKSVFQMNQKEFKQYVDDTFIVSDSRDIDAKICAYTNTRVEQYNNYIRSYNNLSPLLQENEPVIVNAAVIIEKEFVIPTNTFTKISEIVDDNVWYRGVQGRKILLEQTGNTVFFQPNSLSDKKKVLQNLRKNRNWDSWHRVNDSWLDLRPGYASTIHKTQGKTFKEIAIDLHSIGSCYDDKDTADTIARLLYVAESRASNKVILYGNLPTEYGGDCEFKN